jgi:hypothetical protein
MVRGWLPGQRSAEGGELLQILQRLAAAQILIRS